MIAKQLSFFLGVKNVKDKNETLILKIHCSKKKQFLSLFQQQSEF